MLSLHTPQGKTVLILSFAVFAIGLLTSTVSWRRALVIPVSMETLVINTETGDCEELLTSEENTFDALDRLYDTADQLDARLRKTKSTASAKHLQKQLDGVEALIAQGEHSLKSIDERIDALCYL